MDHELKTSPVISPNPDPVPPAPIPVPQPITPSKAERMHPDDPNLVVVAMFYPSDYFTPHGSHTFLVDGDFVMSWANAGKDYFEAKGLLPLTEIARTTVNYDWIMTFSPVDGDKWYETGINFGYNGVCHTITNRQLMLGDVDADVSKAPTAFISTAIFGKYGMGIEDLKKRLTDSFNAASKLSKQQDGALERAIARLDYPLSEDLDAWHRTSVVLCQMPFDRFNHPDIDTGYLSKAVQDLKAFREQFFLNHAKDLPRRQFQQTIAIHMLNMVNGLLGYMRRQNYITAGEFSKYLDTAQQSLNRMFRVLELQNQSAQETGKFIPDLALQLLLTDAASTVSAAVDAASRNQDKT